MKKAIPMLVAATAMGVAAWLFVSIYKTIGLKKEIAQRVQHLPTLPVLGLDSTAFGTTQWAGSQPLIVFYFDSTCEHCQSEATELSKQAQAFAEVRVLWLSVQPLAALRQFEREYGLQKKITTLKIGQISQDAARQQFGFVSTPTILIYDATGNLTKKYVGQTKIAAIVKHIQ